MSASPAPKGAAKTSQGSSAGAMGGGGSTPLFSNTQRPDEPVTAGAPFGPGAGPATSQVPNRVNYSSLYSRMAMENPNDDTLAMLALAQRLGY